MIELNHIKEIKMKLNKLGFMSLIALLGIFGLTTENKGFLGFFGCLSYIRYFTVIPDELFKENVKKAGSIGFFTGMAVSTIMITLCILFEDFITPISYFVSGYVVSVFAFSLTLLYLEYKEQRGL